MLNRILQSLRYPTFIFLLLLFWGHAHASQDNQINRGQPLENELYKIRKTLEAALITIEEMKAQLLNPKWEYRIILPNMMNSSGQSREGIHDGVNFNLMGKDGWELVNYSVQYGFIFKKRVH